MSKLTNILLLNLVAGFTTAAFGSVKTTQIENIDLTTTLASTNEWGISVSASVKPVQLISFIALNNPIQLSVYCGDALLSEPASIFYDDSMIGNVYPLNVAIKKIPSTCKPSTFSFRLNPNGVELDVGSPIFSYTPVDLGEKTEVYIDRISASRATNKVAITTYVSKLATYAGSKEALYCVIAGNLDDILTGGVAKSVQTQYENIYGPYKPNQFTCPVDAEGKLTSSINFCTANPGEIEPFCLVLEKYKSLSAWYDDTIAEINSRKSSITSTQSDIYAKIEALRKDLEADQELFTVIVE